MRNPEGNCRGFGFVTFEGERKEFQNSCPLAFVAIGVSLLSWRFNLASRRYLSILLFRREHGSKSARSHEAHFRRKDNRSKSVQPATERGNLLRGWWSVDVLWVLVLVHASGFCITTITTRLKWVSPFLCERGTKVLRHMNATNVIARKTDFDIIIYYSF